MAREFALPAQTGNAGKVLTTDGTNVSWGAGGGGGSVVTDGTTIGGNGTSGSPLTSLQSTFGRISPISGVVNGTNLVFTIPSGYTVNELFDGTQFQNPSIYSQSGTTITFTAGNAPTVGLTAFGASAPILANNTYVPLATAATYAAAVGLASGTQPFLILVQASSQFNNAPTMYFYDGINTGHVNQIASLLI